MAFQSGIRPLSELKNGDRPKKFLLTSLRDFTQRKTANFNGKKTSPELYGRFMNDRHKTEQQKSSELFEGSIVEIVTISSQLELIRGPHMAHIPV
jgi:hypothetical protein